MPRPKKSKIPRTRLIPIVEETLAVPSNKTTPQEEEDCVICISAITDKCKTDSCRHEFCYPCLEEWTKEKNECPLCKAKIKTIRHNIRVEDGIKLHDEYAVPETENEEHGDNDFLTTLQGLMEDAGMADIAARLRGSGMDELWAMVHERERGSFLDTIGIYSRLPHPTPEASYSGASTSTPAGAQGVPSGQNDNEAETEEERGNEAEASHGSVTLPYQRRRRIYDRGQYVNTIRRVAGVDFDNFSDTHTCNIFRIYSSQYRRVEGWLKRELKVLLRLTQPRATVTAVYNLIISQLDTHDIRSEEMRDMLRPYFASGALVRHFQHECYNFIMSGFTMDSYDLLTENQYGTGRNVQNGDDAAPTEEVQEHNIEMITIDEDDETPNQITSANVKEPGGPSSASGPSNEVGRRRGQRRHRQETGPLLSSSLSELVADAGTGQDLQSSNGFAGVRSDVGTRGRRSPRRLRRAPLMPLSLNDHENQSRAEVNDSDSVPVMDRTLRQIRIPVIVPSELTIGSDSDE